MEHNWNEQLKRAEHAKHLLANPDLLLKSEDMGGFHVELRLWHYPTFEPWTVWLLCHSARDGVSYEVREIVWDNGRDSNRSVDPSQNLKLGSPMEPDFRMRVASLSPAEIEPRVAVLRNISFPAFMETDINVRDGENFGIAAASALVNAEISWWCEGPDEWQEVTRWFKRMRDYLTAQLDSGTM